MKEGNRQIQIKFRANLVNLVNDNKKTLSASSESDNRHFPLFDNGQIVIRL